MKHSLSRSGRSSGAKPYRVALFAGVSGFLGAALFVLLAAHFGVIESNFGSSAGTGSGLVLEASSLDARSTDGNAASRGGADLFFAAGTTQILAPNGQGITINGTGSVGIGIESPTRTLDVLGYVKGRTGLCIGTDCRTAWPTFTDTNSGGTVTSVAAGSGLTGSPSSTITGSGTISLNLGSANTWTADQKFTGYITAKFVNATTGLCISGQCRESWPASGSGTVTSVATSTGLTGGTITGSGTISLNINGGSTQSCSGTQKVSSISSAGIVGCGNDVDTDTNSGGTVTSVATSGGLRGGTITSSGTLSLDPDTMCVLPTRSGSCPSGFSGPYNIGVWHRGSDSGPYTGTPCGYPVYFVDNDYNDCYGNDGINDFLFGVTFCCKSTIRAF